MEVVDDLISRDLLKRVGSSCHANQKRIQLEIEDDVMEDSSPDVELQVCAVSACIYMYMYMYIVYL